MVISQDHVCMAGTDTGSIVRVVLRCVVVVVVVVGGTHLESELLCQRQL